MLSSQNVIKLVFKKLTFESSTSYLWPLVRLPQNRFFCVILRHSVEMACRLSLYEHSLFCVVELQLHGRCGSNHGS
jgi:hypothetical protein